LSVVWSDLFPWLDLVQVLLIAVALFGGPLLWARVRHRPITKAAVLEAAGMVIAIVVFFALGTAATNAYERGLISHVASIAIVALVTVAFVGVSIVLQRLYPSPKE
jgi:hypothetical protein